MWIRQGQDGKLDHGGAIDQSVKDSEFEAMNDVLGVVQYDGLRFAVVGGLVLDQRVVQMIEAVGLGRRSVGGNLDRLHVRVHYARDRCCGCRIVTVMADEYPVMVVVEPVERRLEHWRDDRSFVPGGDQDRDQAGVLGEYEITGKRTRVARVDGQRAPDASSEIDQVHGEVVDGEQQKADACEQRQLGRDPAQYFSKKHGPALGGS